MYGEWVTLELGEVFDVRVFVFCVPRMPPERLRELAIEQLRRRLARPITI